MKKNASNLFFFILVGILSLGIASAKGFLKPNVLGWTSLLADRGSEDSHSGGGGEGTSGGSSNTSGSGNSGGGTSGGGGNVTTTTNSTGGGGGNEGHQLTAPPTFSAKKRNTQEGRQVRELKQKESERQNVTTPTAFFDFRRNEEKASLRVTRFGSLIEFKTEDHEASPEGEQENDENQNETEDKALHDVNEALKTEDVEVSTNAAGLVVRHGETEAETHFPLSVNTTTHELTVTTPGGTKTVKVLPDTAVNNLLNQGVLTNVETQPATPGAAATNKVAIVEFNNQAAFEVHGTVEKKLFGVIPFGQGKKVFVSAQTGGVLSQSEDVLGQLLGLFSF